ncbi:MAG: PEPxxWA-CTERM sorting domain-containing protein [Sphingomonadaceae bacterium]
MKLAFGGTGAAFLIAFATPASAALTLGATPCVLTDITPTATACGGWYQGNLNNGSPAGKADSAAALNALLGVASFTGPTLTWLEDFAVGGNSVDFATPLYGQTVVSFHVGAANGQATGVGYQATAFYLFDAGNAGLALDVLGFNRAGLSNARLYSTERVVSNAVPEPATWAMMISGFGAVGATLRRARVANAAIV